MTDYAEGALRLEVQGSVATLTLNRPEARNALNLAMWRTLPGLVGEVAADPAIRVLIVRGAGGNFASGADIAEFPIVFANHASALDYGALIERATAALAGLEKPVIAQIEGFCIGAGLAIALACDMRIGAADAKLGAPPAKLGLIYSLADTRRLIHAVGASAAKTMLFTAALHPAAEAHRLGLLDDLHAPDALETAIQDRAKTLCALSPWSIRKTKAIVAMVLEGVAEDTPETRAWFADAVEGADFAEGLAAFRAKRPPVF